MMTSSGNIESPRKRVKVFPDSQALTMPEAANMPAEATSAMPQPERVTHAAKEAEVGITAYVSSEALGFRGMLKKRYTDFIVNEILPNGKVVHLQRLGKAAKTAVEEEDPKAAIASGQNGTDVLNQGSSGSAVTPSMPLASLENPGQEERNSMQPEYQKLDISESRVSVDDITKLLTSLGEKAVEELLALYNRILANPAAKSRDHGLVTSKIPDEKSVRTTLHQDIRRIFDSRIESSTDKEKDVMTFSAALPANKRPSNQPQYRTNHPRRQGKLGWEERGGEYLHFTLYKENKDTMEVISHLSRQLKINAKSFQFAGTKDRRAVTAQRASAYRVEEDRLSYQNKMLRNSSVGDFEYQKRGLELGDLKGNEFVITLRDCEWEDLEGSIMEKISAAEKRARLTCRDVCEKGFFNYYGLQRFGTFSTRTDAIGIKLLQGDFQGACESILHYDAQVLTAAQDQNSTEQISSDGKSRAEAIEYFQRTGRSKEALDRLPRKYTAEANLIRHLGRNKTDYPGAIQTIQRNLRLMYVHAYQSLIWNFAVEERWRLFGNQVVEGDLVLVNDHKDKVAETTTVTEEVDADGEVIILPDGEDRAQVADELFERARALTAHEASSGKYSTFDIVLPLPGFDVLYPENAMTEFYKTFMGSDRGGGLDPFNMRRNQKDFSLSGSYRKMLARIEPGYDVQVRAYKDDNEQFVDTDMDIIKNGGTEAQSGTVARREPEEGDKLAMVLKLQLGSSQYATMALRELSKSGIEAYKPDYGGFG